MGPKIRGNKIDYAILREIPFMVMPKETLRAIAS